MRIYDTTPEHAEIYGLVATKPLFIVDLCVSDLERLSLVEGISRNNGNDLLFGHVSTDVETIKRWLDNNGYEVRDENDDFHKLIKPNK